MSTQATTPGEPLHDSSPHHNSHSHVHMPTVPEAVASLLRTVVVALFLLTFIVQPLLIPSESMEHTLLVGDFLLFNRQEFAPAGMIGRWIMPYRNVERGDIIVFHHPNPPLLIKRVVGMPGDHLRIEDGRVFVNGAALTEPYATFEPAPPNPFRENFPADVYTDPQIDPDWWHQMRGLTAKGELVIPPGEYFVLGDNRNHSLDSRYWGLVPRQAIVARPLIIYFSLTRPSTTDVQTAALPPRDDRLGHDSLLPEKIAGFARWKRILHVVH